MTEELKTAVNTIIDEMGRMEERMNKRMGECFEQVDKHFDKMEIRLESMQHEINKRTA